MLTRPRAAIGIVNVRATLLDDARWFAPWMETQVVEALPWATTGAARSFDRFPAMDDYTGLIERYRRDRGATTR